MSQPQHQDIPLEQPRQFEFTDYVKAKNREALEKTAGQLIIALILTSLLWLPTSGPLPVPLETLAGSLWNSNTITTAIAASAVMITLSITASLAHQTDPLLQ